MDENYPWFGLYRAAMLELDSNKVIDRIAAARRVLDERLREGFKLTPDERNAIVDAKTVLQMLEDNERRLKRRSEAAQ